MSNIDGGKAQGAGGNVQTHECLKGLEDKPLMDEFVALYIGMITGSKKLEQQFREQLSVSLLLVDGLIKILTSCVFYRAVKMKVHII